METNFVINQKLIGNPSTIYKTVNSQIIIDECNNLNAAFLAIDPEFEGINIIEAKKTELISWYQTTVKLYEEALSKAAKKPAKKERKPKAEKKEKVVLKKSRLEEAQGRLDKYSNELVGRETELKDLKSAEEPDKAAVKKVTKRIASLKRKIKRAMAAIGRSDQAPVEE